MPVPTRQVVKEALLVGVSYVTNTNLNENGFPIQAGAHKDMMSLRRLLTRRYDYRDEDITTLVDSEDTPHESWPTRDNIIRAMKKLIAGKQAGDHIVFSFSGHGGQVRALVDIYEVDGMDEILLPVDCTFDPEAEAPDNFVNFIRDDEIRDIFVNQLAEGVRCTMIFDCCHSGTASDLPNVEEFSPVTTPDSPLFSPRSTAPRAPRAFAQMETLHDGHTDSAPYMWPTARSAYPPSFRYFDKDVTSWSACLDDGITFGKKSGGIFMKAFTQVLHSTPNLTHKELLKYLRKHIFHVTEEENQKLEERRKSDVLSRESDLFEDYVAPRPQLGSLRPDSILLAPFTL
ncbi:peptidase C14 [Ganoderma leucocontextum]|nr:peptidase C14 [Ganoderma leucocontextum]